MADSAEIAVAESESVWLAAGAGATLPPTLGPGKIFAKGDGDRAEPRQLVRVTLASPTLPALRDSSEAASRALQREQFGQSARDELSLALSCRHESGPGARVRNCTVESSPARHNRQAAGPPRPAVHAVRPPCRGLILCSALSMAAGLT